jgi:prepilin-type N-terminal cleavage/methylation domain-containing protein
MKTILKKCDQPSQSFGSAGKWQVAPSSLRFDATRSDKKDGSTLNPQPSTLNHFRAFTLVEMLVVIAIIGILAAILLPVLAGARKAAQKSQAKVEISQIVGAIQQYDSVYGRFPVSSGTPSAQSAAAATTPPGDYTYGAGFQSPTVGSPVNLVNATYAMSNCEVIAILMDLTTNAVTHQIVNWNHAKNPQQTIFLNAKMSGWDPSQPGLPAGGVGNDLVYRDPWGNPYVISMDLNYDEQCQDAFYSLTQVSSTAPPANPPSGINGLANPDGTLNNYRYHGKVMVWSAGPDGMIDNNASADKGANKDNILSWAQ